MCWKCPLYSWDPLPISLLCSVSWDPDLWGMHQKSLLFFDFGLYSTNDGKWEEIRMTEEYKDLIFIYLLAPPSRGCCECFSALNQRTQFLSRDLPSAHSSLTLWIPVVASSPCLRGGWGWREWWRENGNNCNRTTIKKKEREKKGKNSNGSTVTNLGVVIIAIAFPKSNPYILKESLLNACLSINQLEDAIYSCWGSNWTCLEGG